MGFNKIFQRKSRVKADTTTGHTRTTHPIISLWGTKKGKNRPSTSKQATEALGGKYLSKKHGSLRSIETEDITETSGSWKSCRSRDYKQSLPLSPEAQAAQWGRAIEDARRLPRTSHFANNHIMVNAERTKRTIPAVKRCSSLDAAARQHAETMALEGKVRHSDAKGLQAELLNDNDDLHLGENVGTGDSIRAIHHEMMETVGDVRNMCDRRYTQMGMATARGANGVLYLCQIFRG